MRISPEGVVRHIDPGKSYCLPIKIRKQVLKRDHYHCVFCGEWTTYVAHDKLLCLGGTDTVDNLVTCCRNCRTAKDRMSVAEYKEALEIQKEMSTEEKYLLVDVIFAGDRTIKGEIERLPSVRDRVLIMRQTKPKKCLTWINLDSVKQICTITRMTRLVQMDL
jgi:hypothetical protein